MLILWILWAITLSMFVFAFIVITRWKEIIKRLKHEFYLLPECAIKEQVASELKENLIAGGNVKIMSLMIHLSYNVNSTIKYFGGTLGD